MRATSLSNPSPASAASICATALWLTAFSANLFPWPVAEAAETFADHLFNVLVTCGASASSSVRKSDSAASCASRSSDEEEARFRFREEIASGETVKEGMLLCAREERRSKSWSERESSADKVDSVADGPSL